MDDGSGDVFRVEVEVVEVRSYCPVYRKGDKMVIEMPELLLDETDRVCIHALTAMQTLLQAIARGYSAKRLSICASDDEGYVLSRGIGML